MHIPGVAPVLGGIIGGVGGFFAGGPMGAVAGGTAGASAGSAYDTNQENRGMAKDANNANITSAREQMAFQERMSSSQHQRQIEDLKRAGLNPLLSATGGASSPAGASATSTPSTSQNPLAGLQAQAMQSILADQQISAGDAAIGLTKAQTAKAKMDTLVASKELPKADAINKAYDFGKSLLNRAQSTAKEAFKAKDKAEQTQKLRDAAYQHQRFLQWRAKKRNPYEQRYQIELKNP